MLALVVLALIFFVVRPMLNRKPDTAALAELAGPEEYTSQPTPALEGPAEPEGGDVLDAPPQSVTKIERLREVIASRSDDSAAVLRGWIETPEPIEEPVQS